jgi:uncharacterized lipoprotein
MSGIHQEPQMNSKSRAIRPLLIVGIASLAIVTAPGCGWIKDKTHYKDSREANPLEVPPDLDKPDTTSATALPTVASLQHPVAPASLDKRFTVSAADAYPRIGDVLAATPGVVVNGKAEALFSYDVTYKGESFLLRVLDSTGGSRIVALSPDGRMLTTGSAAELIASIKSKF